MPDSMVEATRQWRDALLPAVWSGGVASAFFVAIGWTSLRALRRFPDFPEKAAMLRGAKWGGLAFTGLVVLSFGIMWLAAGYGLCMAGVGIGKAVFWIGFAVSLHRYRFEGDGLLLGGQYFARYRRQGPEKWLEDWRKRQPTVERWNRILVFWWPVLILLWLSFGAWGYWHSDRMLLAIAVDETLGKTLQQDLGDPRVVKVVPMRWLFEGPLFPLHVHVAVGTTKEAGDELAERLRRLLSLRKDGTAWRITVRPRYGHTLARATYAPPGVILPEGVEHQHRKPRRW